VNFRKHRGFLQKHQSRLGLNRSRFVGSRSDSCGHMWAKRAVGLDLAC
jgi:hypothetical protein